MPRQARQASGTGIYHVMMRGINHQNIFEEQEDYYQFLNTLDMMALSYEPDGTPSGRNYILYAYCLMSNHIHLLIREREDTIGMAIKRIASSYVYYYNHKYSRDGHLLNSSAFQQLPADIKKSVLIELKGKRASLRQLERLTGISKSMIYRM